jgi:hypothetical protein
MCGLLGIADVEFNVIRTEKRQKVFCFGDYFFQME